MADLAVILGSGFSKPAGLPLASEINSYFTRDNSENILKFSSGEFLWDDFANETYKHNGRIGFDHIAYGILLNEFVAQFIIENREFTNYEDFYQMVIDSIYDDKKIEIIKAKSLEAFHKRSPDIKNNHFYKIYISAIENFHAREFRSMVNHLISDLLYVRKKREEIEQLYQCVIELFKSYNSIDFVTLNHDLLLEYLITTFLKREYSDGFTKDQKILKSSEGEPLNLFQGTFSEGINIIKLHGSIDTYRYSIAVEKGGIINPTGEYLYFKTKNYDEKQRPIRHDPETSEIVQTFHWEIDPDIITGTRKKEILSMPGMYKSLFEESEHRILNCKTLLIIGYSFGDEHVNEAIELAILFSAQLEKIIVVNPSKKIPFDVSDFENHHLNAINELSTLL